MRSSPSIRIEQITDARDIARCFEIACLTFGEQTDDTIWMAWNPGWNTPEGKRAGIGRMTRQWAESTRNQDGALNTLFVKATVADAESSDLIVGYAMFVQGSVIPGYGDPPVTDVVKEFDLENLYPGDASMHRFICQLTASLFRQRNECMLQAASRSPPAIILAEICGVDPRFQGHGIGAKLLQWGLDMARSRGDLESVLEASVAGRPVWRRVGYREEGGLIEYQVDEEFAGRRLPDNIFMRTQPFPKL